MEYKEYWFPVRMGLRVRRALLSFGKSYGGWFISIRRPIAVFLNTLLDDKHQEVVGGTIHNRFIQ